MRFDRELSIVFSKIFLKTVCPPIPILMYHSVHPSINCKAHPYFCTGVTPEKFCEHLRYISERGFKVRTLDELPVLINRPCKERSVVITFDDGYEDFYEFAFPVLQKYNMRSTVFVPSGLISSTERKLGAKRLMTWDQIIACSDWGIEIGSHSVSHRKLIDLNNDEVKAEIFESKRDIEKKVKKPVVSFSYPYKFPEEKKDFVAQLCSLLPQAGYQSCVTTRIGCTRKGDNRFLLKRIPVNEFDDGPLLNAKLNGYYDWLHVIQLISKKIRNHYPVD